jgi:hypothetical protein
MCGDTSKQWGTAVKEDDMFYGGLFYYIGDHWNDAYLGRSDLRACSRCRSGSSCAHEARSVNKDDRLTDCGRIHGQGRA